MIWFTADEHYAHSNILKYCNRPFDDVQQMNKEIVGRHNDVVRRNDTVYHIGDFTLNGISDFWYYAEQLNGAQHYVLPGSHDHRWLKDFKSEYAPTYSRWSVLPALISLEFPQYSKDGYPLVVVLCHYSLRTWDRSHHGSIQLYGHSHGNLPAYGLRAMDVGVDCHDFKPVSLDYVIEKLHDTN